jgi:hypothetical protein
MGKTAQMLPEWDEACAVEVDGIDPDPDSDSDLHETRRPSPVVDNGSVAPLPFRLLSLNLAAPPCHQPNAGNGYPGGGWRLGGVTKAHQCLS